MGRKGSQAAGNQHQSDSSEKTHLPPRTATCKVKENGTAIECKWAEGEPESYLKRFASPENAPNIALFVVGLGGIAVALCTLRTIRDQTNELIAQNRTMVAKERARLDLRAKAWRIDWLAQYWHPVAGIAIRNIGAGRAFIMRSRVRLLALPAGSPLPDLEELWGSLSLPDKFIDPSPSPIEVEISAMPGSDDLPAELSAFTADMLASRLRIHILGFIEYETLGTNWHRDFQYTRDLVGLVDLFMGRPEPKTDEERVLRGWWQPIKDEEYEIKAK